MDLLRGILFAFMSAAGFAVLFNIPRRSIAGAGFAGSLGWFVYLILEGHGFSKVVASFAAALIIGICGEFFAKLSKKPATIYIVSGIIVLVPGYGFYESMHFLAMSEYTSAAKTGSESFFITIAIACGIIIASSVMKLVNPGFIRKHEE